ncbi:N-6 DNA methylase [Campylobacter sp. MIT 21-1685]|nr:N-6 DNA methylase [Campylobacter sp. MIT 21-1684]MCX2751672.1 N-6 DNA methylase [Campylobacter sp. MIT 21-1682]MCX2807873.1 N-6 DNA methylase [Campylobacter sp. MIT 21-1685]
MRDSGVSYTDYVAQVSYLLFLKMESERESIGESSKIPQECKWERLICLDGLELESAYNAALLKLSKQEGIIGLIYNDAQNKIKEPANLKKLFTMVDSETWLGLKVDIKGAIYEGLLAKNATETKAGAGQYFTPRVLIDSIMGLMELQPNMEVCDPACGTGGFLLSAYEVMKAQTKDKEELKKLRSKRLYGKDITPLVASLCAMNLYLHGIGGEGSVIEIGDSLSELGNRRFDRVLTNPPFGKKSASKILAENGKVKSQKEEYSREDFFATTSNKQLNFLQHIMNLLKVGGKAAVVLPDNVLFEGGAGERVRKKLLEDFNLHTILRLPTGIFYAQGVKANVLFFDKVALSEDATQSVWVYDMRTNFNLSLVSNPLSKEHLRDFEACFCVGAIEKRKESERFSTFDIGEIKRRDKMNLDIFWLKDESLEDLENLPSPKDLSCQISTHLKGALKEVEGLGVR